MSEVYNVSNKYDERCIWFSLDKSSLYIKIHNKLGQHWSIIVNKIRIIRSFVVEGNINKIQGISQIWNQMISWNISSISKIILKIFWFRNDLAFCKLIPYIDLAYTLKRCERLPNRSYISKFRMRLTWVSKAFLYISCCSNFSRKNCSLCLAKLKNTTFQWIWIELDFFCCTDCKEY